MQDYRALFPITRERAYLNHAAIGPFSTRVVDAVQRFAQAQATQADHASAERKAQRETTRRKLAELIGAHPTEIAIVKNTPDALGMVAAGLRWKLGDKIVSSDQEFPANIYPWLNLAERGVELDLVESCEGRVPPEALLEAIDPRTRLVALSWIEFSTGYRNDLAAIGRACREQGALLAVDAIQGVGALRLDVKQARVDFLALSSHKWMLGPLGVGWFYCRRELQDQLDVVMVGQASVVERPSYLDYSLELWPDARRFENGAPNAMGIAGVEAALDLFAEVGMEEVEARIKALTDRLVAGLAERGYRPAARRGPDDWSGIVSFECECHTPEELHAGLQAANISTAVRERRVRVSPHFYNVPEEIDALLAALPPVRS
ncbi:MAG TPA: aminotransferase class V-fold PLP-dependent enzyme [Chloroflexota bacterium]|nr:aminotransferase class V-fold PLP-dependent enzyme [Chloroflexota bacterium]